MAAASGREEAGLFLASHGAQANHTNKHGEMPLHVAARKGLAKLVSELLNKLVKRIISRCTEHLLKLW